jgi:hypothetical protein
VIPGWLGQAERQIQASDGRAIHWYFAEKAAAEYVEKLFWKNDAGRERIKIVHLPWKEGQKWK